MKTFNTLLRHVLVAIAASTGAALAQAADTANNSPDLIKQGQYLATASDCAACHTAKGGKPFAGGLAISSPVGIIYSTNITPSTGFGIGNYTEAQFEQALRRGIRPDGAHLYSAMPYTSYAVLTDADVHALYTYFMQGVAPVNEAAPRTDLPFPLNIRASMMIWNFLFLKNDPYQPDPHQSEEWNRGKYLVLGAAHCSACHTPRGFMMQEESGLDLAGGQVGPWYAPNITPDVTSGIGSLSKEELVQYLRTGAVHHKMQAAGSMGEAVEHSFQYLSDADLNAIATYIQTIPAIHDSADKTSRFTLGQPSSELATLRGENGIRSEIGSPTGAELFQSNCASCHSPQGQGSKDGYYPSLFDNSTVGASNANNLIATILHGVNRTTAKGQAYMPGFGGSPYDRTSLSNKDIVLLSNYVRGLYGPSGTSVTEDQVAEVRRGGPSSSLVLLARVGVAAGVIVVVLILLFLFARRRRSLS